MTTARKVGRGLILAGLLGSFVAALLTTGGLRHVPWIAAYSLITLAMLWWNGRSEYRHLDAGEEVFLAVLVIFVTMLGWARVGF